MSGTTMSDGLVPAKPGVMNILNESQQNTTFEKMLKFDRGIYTADGVEVALGTKVICHVVGWAKEWIKFQDKRFIERKIFRIERGDKVLTRDELDCKDESLWEKFRDGPKDPWVFRYLLPLTIADTDEPMIFVTPSRGGQRAVDDLANTYARRALRDLNCGQPIAKIGVKYMPTQNWGKVARPSFDIIGWADTSVAVRELSDAAMKKADFEDEIPF